MKTAKRALVVGGGVIGLTSAFQLARHGWRVTLLDPKPGGGATWAAAGMIAPIAEIGPGQESNYELQRGAVDAWRLFAKELRDVTNKELAIVENGTLLLGWDGSDRRLVDQFSQIALELGAEPRRVSREEEAPMFEGVSPRIADGLLVGGDAWLDPDQVVALVREANAELGVTMVEESVISVCGDGTRVEAQTESASFTGDIGILAVGAHDLPQGAATSGSHTVRPIHGITVRVRGIDRSAQPMIRSFVRGGTFYMVSRPGGYDVLGGPQRNVARPVRRSVRCSVSCATRWTSCRSWRPPPSSRREKVIDRRATTCDRSSKCSPTGVGRGHRAIFVMA